MYVVVDSLFAIAPIACRFFVFGPCFVVQYLVSFLVLQSSHWGRERWLLKNCFKCHVTVSALCLFLTVQCVGLQCVIVVFPSHNPFTFFMRF